MRVIYKVLIVIVVLAGITVLGLYLGGVFTRSAVAPPVTPTTNTTAATVSAPSAPAVTVSAPTPVVSTRAMEYPGDIILTGESGFGKRVSRYADVLMVYSDRKTYQYRGGDLVSEREGVYFGEAGVQGKKAKIDNSVIYEDDSLIKPIGHDDINYYFMHKNALVVYDKDTRQKKDIYRGDERIIDAYMGDEAVVILFSNKVRVYYHDGTWFYVKTTVNVGAPLSLAQFNEGMFLVGFENRVELYDADGRLLSTLRAPEPAESFGAVVAHFNGRIYVGAPRERSVYVFAKVDDLWLPYAAYSRDSSEFGKSIEADRDFVYIGSSDRVYVV